MPVQKCEVCGATDHLQIHHDSYIPPKTRILCIKCHETFHGHGVGNRSHSDLSKIYKAFKDETSEVLVIRVPRRMRKTIDKIVRKGVYRTMSAFIRAAIQEKAEEITTHLSNEEEVTHEEAPSNDGEYSSVFSAVVHRSGSSLVVTIPKGVADGLALVPGVRVRVVVTVPAGMLGAEPTQGTDAPPAKPSKESSP